MTMIHFGTTNLGNKIGRFTDLCGTNWRIEESEPNKPQFVWLGEEGSAWHSMRLNRLQAGVLANALSYFSEHGKLHENDE